MSDFSFNELRSLIRESLGENFPALLEGAPKLPQRPPAEARPGEEGKGVGKAEAGLLELRKIAALQRTFSPKEKASALSKFAGKRGTDPWAVLHGLKKSVEEHAKKGLTATCPDELIMNVVTLASFADLLFSERTGQAKGWFMEEWVAEATAGKVIPAGRGESNQGTADIVTGDGALWSVKLTGDTKIKGSPTEFLNGFGYEAVDSNEELALFKRTSEPQKPVNYLFFKKSGTTALKLEIFKIDGVNIYNNIFKKLTGTEGAMPEELRIPKATLAGDLGKVSDYREQSESMEILFNLEESIQFANESAQIMFQKFNAIAESFDTLITTMTAFYGEPDDAHKKEASAATKGVDAAVSTFATSCIPEKTT